MALIKDIETSIFRKSYEFFPLILLSIFHLRHNKTSVIVIPS